MACQSLIRAPALAPRFGGVGIPGERRVAAQPRWQTKAHPTGSRRLAALSLAIAAQAQDLRHVTEPVIPPSCAVVTARSTGPDDAAPDTRLQDALDRCEAGHAVELKPEGASNSFLSGPIQLRAGVTRVAGANATLYGSRDPRGYDTPGGCGVVNRAGHGCKPLIAGNRVAHAGVMGDGAIDGRGGAILTGQNVSWWDLAQEAKVKNLNQSCPRIMTLTGAGDFSLYRITLKNPPNFHASYSGGNGFTAWGVVIDTPKTARNTGGIHSGNSTNVTITHCYIHAGDDHIAIKAGHGAPTTHMTISHNHFCAGHGMSIGSETDGGASAIRVSDLSIDGADNGIRIKSNSSRGGLVNGIIYKDMCIRDAKKPILMDSNYSSSGPARAKLPRFTGIVLRNVRILSAGKITLAGFGDAHRLGIAFRQCSIRRSGENEDLGRPRTGRAGPGAGEFPSSGRRFEDCRRTGRGSPKRLRG